MICRLVCPSICPVHCRKTADRNWMPFGVVGRTGPGMRQVWGAVHRKGYFWGQIWGTPLYPVGTLRRTLLSVSTVGAVVWGGSCNGLSHCCIRMGPRRARGREDFGCFVLHFYNGKCHRVTDGVMFRIRMRKLHIISVQRTSRWKARFVGFLAILFTFKIKVGVYEKLAKT